VSLQGAKELRSRLRAFRQVFKPIGKSWADETVRRARGAVPVKTGRLQRSIRVRNASQRKATVAAHYTAAFVDAGTMEHTIVPRQAKTLKFNIGSQTVFAKKVRHPRTAARPFRARVAREALERTPLAQELIKAWNSSGGGRSAVLRAGQ
jgi:hypothetical protein